MIDERNFKIVGIRATENDFTQCQESRVKPPFFSIVVFALIFISCIFAGLIATKNPTYLDLANCNHAPNGEFLFGTDNLGRDIFSCIWHGGRISIFIGLVATLLST